MALITISNNTGATYSGANQNHIVENAPGNNFGNDSEFTIQSFFTGQRAHMLLSFDGLSSVTPGGTVSGAEIGLYIITSATPKEIALRKLLRDWSLTNSRWAFWDDPLAWTVAGALGNGTDRESTIITTATPSGTGVYLTFSGTALDTLVQGWIDGTIPNYGVEGELTDDTFYMFDTARFIGASGVDGQRPYLEFDYSAGGVTVALTGQTITSGIGSLKANISESVTGQSVTSAIGNVKANVSEALTGQSITSQQGTLNDAVSVILTGQQISSQIGNVSTAGSVSRSITGQQINSQQGNVTAIVVGDIVRAITGQAISAQIGNVSVPETNNLFGGVAHFQKLDDYNKKRKKKQNQILLETQDNVAYSSPKQDVVIKSINNTSKQQQFKILLDDSSNIEIQAQLRDEMIKEYLLDVQAQEEEQAIVMMLMALC